ncbi:helicase HerA-like C-terminal domain-containing protein [Edaphobacter aggregans]|uniref:helicase HerA-like C-terminal domain-containing protein n=1 Tax=Edaphobacter aggregans TaxID=570835 RepID=UPI0005588518|nr:helicase HerA-like C-terminal domain-containing protein [Edaphobacter aggregans]
MTEMEIAKGNEALCLLAGMSNRHGLVAGATGTGKTVTLQVMAEALSSIGVPVFAADVKGDLSGISQPGKSSPKFDERVKSMELGEWSFAGCPVVFWDVFGEEGHPVRATVSEMGPLLMSRILNLNETQTGVLTLVFKIADDSGLLLLDMKDLQAMLQEVATRAKGYQTQYGNISAASIGAIQRGLVALGEQGGDQFFGEPALNIDDLLQTEAHGKGVVNILAADKLLESPQLYATFLLWLMSELFEKLPEVGDPEKPKLVFFFDEAHLLFNDLPPVLQSKIEQVVRLIRSKGVGIFFVTQNPIDVPETVLGQLGNRVQHALRAFSPKDQKAVKAAAQTFRANPTLDVEEVITQLGVGEALVSFLDEKGIPDVVERAMVCPPHSQIGPITPEQRAAIIKGSVVAGVYETAVDRESAYEKLKGKVAASTTAAAPGQSGVGSPTLPQGSEPGWLESASTALGGVLGGGGSRRGDTVVQAMVKSAARTMGSTVGRQIIRGVLGSLLGGSSSRR